MNDPAPGDDLQQLLRTKSTEDLEMDITPMIDITFLLLIFFLVASKMDPSAAIQLPPARHGFPAVEKSAVIITMAAESDGQAAVYTANGKLDEQRVDGGDIDAQEDEIAAFVEEQIAGGKENVLIKAERGIKHREVARISKAATRPEGVQQLYLAVLEDQQ